MDYFDILLAKKLNGGGGSPIDLQTLTVTENGEQDAPSGVAYNKVITNVPAPSNALFKQTLNIFLPKISSLQRLWRYYMVYNFVGIMDIGK